MSAVASDGLICVCYNDILKRAARHKFFTIAI